MHVKQELGHLITGLVTTFGSIGVIALATILFGDHCWPPRVGGTMVGIAVFIQGYVYAHKKRFSKVTGNGLTIEQRILSKTYFLAVFGTLLWALGDLFPSLYFVPVCQ